MNSVVDATLLVEALSPSTEEYDRGEKFAHCKRIPRLRQHVLVRQDSREVEVWSRGPSADGGDVWTSVVSRDGDVADLAAIGARLDVRELYEAAQGA